MSEGYRWVWLSHTVLAALARLLAQAGAEVCDPCVGGCRNL